MENLDISSFENALSTLDSILLRYKRDNYDVDIRDAVIQRFEYTYSLAIKMLTRFIAGQSTEATPAMTFNETIRQGNKLGLLNNNLEKWTEYRQKRNLTSHTYNEEAAKEVLDIIPEFKDEAYFLLNRLRELL